MDKLISANSIIQKLIPILNENGDMYLAGRIIGVVDSEPVAFDKEKVIEDLKEEGCIVDNEAGNRAVEIVEKGGVD